MLFNSYNFIFLFLPIVLLGYFQLARVSHAYAASWLAITSLLFYGYWNPTYVLLLLASIITNYVFGLWIAKSLAHHSSDEKNKYWYLPSQSILFYWVTSSTQISFFPA